MIGNLIEQYEMALPPGGWPNWVLGNHDNPRIASRVGIDQARIAAMLLLTLRGTPTMYYGDELGMLNVPIPADHVQDPFEKNVPGKGLGRDPSRTPMLWDATPYAGFSDHPTLAAGDTRSFHGQCRMPETRGRFLFSAPPRSIAPSPILSRSFNRQLR